MASAGIEPKYFRLWNKSVFVILKFINHHLGLLQSKKNDLRRNRTRGGRQPGRARAGSPACANTGPRLVPSAENKNESL